MKKSGWESILSGAGTGEALTSEKSWQMQLLRFPTTKNQLEKQVREFVLFNNTSLSYLSQQNLLP